MAYTTVTYTFTNSTTADADQVNQNLTDILNGLSDGTKDINIAALTAAGTATLNGSVFIGNATSDDLTVTARLASHFIPKTDVLYDIGTTALGLRALYLGATGTGLFLPTGTAANPGLTFSGDTNTGLFSKGSDNLGISVGGNEVGNIDSNGLFTIKGIANARKEIADADYTILDNDGYDYVYSSTGLTADRTVTLPTASANTNRVITIAKMDANGYFLIVKGEAAGETINGIAGDTGIYLHPQYVSVTLKCTGAVWLIIASKLISDWISFTPTGTMTTNTTYTGKFRRVGDNLEVQTKASYNGAPNSVTLNVDLPNLSSTTKLLIDTNKILGTTANQPIKGGGSHANAGAAYPVNIMYVDTDTVSPKKMTPSGAIIYNDPITQASPFTIASANLTTIEYTVPIAKYATQA